MKLLSVLVVPPLEGRFEDLGALFTDLPVELVLGTSLPEASLPRFRAETLEELASERARAGARLYSGVAVAEASGLEVDALGGRPGVRSGSFAHEHATDAENNAALLRALEEQPDRPRTARLSSVFAVASPWQETVEIAHGVCVGEIARTAETGYGYASLFAVEELGGRRMADLQESERALVSPRRRAVHELRSLLMQLLVRQLNELSTLF